MLSVAKLVPGQADYYEEQVAQGRDDYYAGRGEAPGRWLGTAAGELGLSGELARGELEGLLRMEVPGREAPLRRTAAERRITVERLDPRSGEPIAERVTLRPLGGYDLVFSTPKSLSVLEQLADPETPEGAHILRTVERAHEAGLQAALAYLEERACVVRMGAGGTERAPGSGFVAARFDHRTSRAQEPHRHSHVIVANAARGPDGKWRALDGRLLLEEHRLAAGYLYEAVVRQAASAQGFRWGPVDKGMAELEGLPRELLRRLSTRREQIEEHMAAQGTRDFRGAQTAALLTRDRKPREGLDLVARRAEWRAIAAEHGLGREEVRALGRQALEVAFGRALGTAPPIAAPSPSALAERLSGPAGLTATRNSFTRPEALRAMAGAHQQGATRERLEAMVDGYLARPEVVSLVVDRGGRERFSTRDLLACEARILAHAEGGRGAGVGVLPAALVEGVIGARAARGRPLTAEQAEVVREVTRSGRRLDVVQALAGTGKTVVLGAIAECYARAGYLVVGAAPTARAARELAGAGVPARTLDGLVASLAARGGFPAGRPVLVLLDEAGAAGSRAWAALCAYTEAAGAKEVCAGDAGQLQSVPAGGAFRALAQAPEALSLRQVLRQREPQHRAALGRAARRRRGELPRLPAGPGGAARRRAGGGRGRRRGPVGRGPGRAPLGPGRPHRPGQRAARRAQRPRAGRGARARVGDRSGPPRGARRGRGARVPGGRARDRPPEPPRPGHRQRRPRHRDEVDAAADRSPSWSTTGGGCATRSSTCPEAWSSTPTP